MGLIILPLMILWLVACIYSLRMGYQLMTANPFLSFGLPLIVIAILCIAANLYLGFTSFKLHKEIWAFEIPMFFLAGKISLLVFSITALSHFFYAGKITNLYILAGMFVMMTTLSFGALIGAFYADTFIEKHNITTTY